jgi:hypothetical protein
MTKVYIAISAIFFGLVAIGHIVRLVAGWQVALGPNDIPMSVSWVALVLSAALTVWGGWLMRRQ